MRKKIAILEQIETNKKVLMVNQEGVIHKIIILKQEETMKKIIMFNQEGVIKMMAIQKMKKKIALNMLLVKVMMEQIPIRIKKLVNKQQITIKNS
jgi:hypothetical protein